MRSAALFTAGCVLGIEEADGRLVCAQKRIVQLEAMLKAAREEVAACNQNKLQLEERKEMFEKQEEVYGRLQRGCRAAAARAEQAMQVHMRRATQGLLGVHHKWSWSRVNVVRGVRPRLSQKSLSECAQAFNAGGHPLAAAASYLWPVLRLGRRWGRGGAGK